MAINLVPTNGKRSTGFGINNSMTAERNINRQIKKDLSYYNDSMLSAIMQMGGGMYSNDELNQIITKLRTASDLGFDLTPTQKYFMINAWA